eukprot:14627340-Alexandrium_andersonii.AAC.1
MRGEGAHGRQLSSDAHYGRTTKGHSASGCFLQPAALTRVLEAALSGQHLAYTDKRELGAANRLQQFAA